jgi:hypothetical protein
MVGGILHRLLFFGLIYDRTASRCCQRPSSPAILGAGVEPNRRRLRPLRRENGKRPAVW